MTAHRFDILTKALATKHSRRAALLASTAGLLQPWASRVGAQNSTPMASPAATPAATEPGFGQEYLFVQTAEAGTWAPKPGESGTYTLTLTGAAVQTIYFSDRPERHVGTVPTEQFLDALGFTPDNPPNAAVVTGGGVDRDVLVIELLDPTYDPDAETLTYDAHILENYQDAGLAFLSEQQQDTELPASFDTPSLFIDDCPNQTVTCLLTCLDGVGYIQDVGTCWHWLPPDCTPCDSNLCNETYAECNGNCFTWTSSQVATKCDINQ